VIHNKYERAEERKGAEQHLDQADEELEKKFLLVHSKLESWSSQHQDQVTGVLRKHENSTHKPKVFQLKSSLL
jgi:hypothetical protein